MFTQMPLCTAAKRADAHPSSVQGRFFLPPAWIRIYLNLHNKIEVMNFSPTRAPGRRRKPRAALARRSSTTLSTGIVDKHKTASASSAYRAFLHPTATTRTN
jgi:hypothetical protein